MATEGLISLLTAFYAVVHRKVHRFAVATDPPRNSLKAIEKHEEILVTKPRRTGK
jgi:hypothetical protein